MVYQGSKRRIAKHILPIMLANRKPGQWWVEPFVGGANAIDKVIGNRIGADKNEYLIAMWKALQNGWVPPDKVSESEYLDIKNNMDKYSKELVAFAMICCAWGARWGAGYARDKTNRNYAKQSKNSLLRQLKYIKDVKFIHSDYKDLKIPENSIIYCDPPYFQTANYKCGINHDEFWQWCRERAKDGHTVFISEYNAPDDFKKIGEMTIKNELSKGKTATEKLFTYKQ